MKTRRPDGVWYATAKVSIGVPPTSVSDTPEESGSLNVPERAAYLSASIPTSELGADVAERITRPFASRTATARSPSAVASRSNVLCEIAGPANQVSACARWLLRRSPA